MALSGSCSSSKSRSDISVRGIVRLGKEDARGGRRYLRLYRLGRWNAWWGIFAWAWMND